MGLKKGPVLLMFAILLPAIFAACPVAAADARTEAVPVERSEGLPARGLIDLRSNFSDGAYDVETLVRMAKDRGFSVVIINDHDRAAMEYGLAPLRNVVKKREEKGSVNRWGASAWLQAIREAEKKHPDMVVIPGDTSAEVISGLIADEAAIGMVNSKTTAVRVIPAIGHKAGDVLDFGGLLGHAPIMPISRFSPAVMIHRGGRIPAPMQALKN